MTYNNKIDFHTHYITPGFNKYLDDNYNGHGDGVKTPAWDIDSHRKMMQDMDIKKSMLAISSPHVGAASTDAEAVQLADEVNAYAAKIVAQYPDEFGLMATLPLPNGKNSAAAVAQIRRDYNPVGYTLPTNSRGVYIGDPSLDDMMTALNDDHALISIHPNEPAKQDINAAKSVKTPLMEFFFDTTRTLVNMSEARIFSRFPNITWIIPHAGALLPIIAERVDIGGKFLAEGDQEPADTLLDVMPHLYYDMAGMVLPYQLPTLMQIVPADHFLYGSDYPYTPQPVIEQLANMLDTTDVLTDTQKKQMFETNGVALLASTKH